MENSLNRIIKFAALAAMGAIVAGCTSAGSAVEPSVSQANLSANKLQFAVGTANFAGTVGLNTVTTYRQPNGLSAVLVSTPTITGPAGFVVNATAAQAGVDSGTNHISGSPQVDPGTAAIPSTFGTAGGAFAYGITPENYTTSGSASYAVYSQPFYNVTSATVQARAYRGGPPLYPQFRDGTFPSAFLGYTQGWDAFVNVTLAAGTYGLSVNVPSANATGITQTASGTLSTVVPLGAMALPTFNRSGANGGTVAFVAPVGVVESIVYITDTTTSAHGVQSSSIFYSAMAAGAGPQVVTFPDNIGPRAFGGPAGPTFITGDTLRVVVVGYNYPAFEASPPGNTSQTPTIVGANGQADITVSPNGGTGVTAIAPGAPGTLYTY